MTNDAIAAADALGAVISSRDASGLDSLYADDIAVWHAVSNAEQSKSENIALLEAVFKVTSRLEYINIRRYLIDGGLVQQHTLSGTFDDGTAMPDLHASLVIKVRDGQIARIEEYFDSAAFAETQRRLTALAAS